MKDVIYNFINEHMMIHIVLIALCLSLIHIFADGAKTIRTPFYVDFAYTLPSAG